MVYISPFSIWTFGQILKFHANPGIEAAAEKFVFVDICSYIASEILILRWVDRESFTKNKRRPPSPSIAVPCLKNDNHRLQ